MSVLKQNINLIVSEIYKSINIKIFEPVIKKGSMQSLDNLEIKLDNNKAAEVVTVVNVINVVNVVNVLTPSTIC